MYIRRAFSVFLDVQSEGSPAAAPVSDDWTLDWRWFCEPAGIGLPSERSLIDWPEWAKLKIQRRESSVPR